MSKLNFNHIVHGVAGAGMSFLQPLDSLQTISIVSIIDKGQSSTKLISTVKTAARPFYRQFDKRSPF